MTGLVTALVALLSQIAPILGDASSIAKVIETLTQLIPVAVQIGEDLVQPIKNIIAALSANSATTADQMAQLQTLDAQYDAAFEAAATVAQSQDS